MRITLEQEVPGIRPEDAASWWSDFQEGHADHTFLPGARRTIVERGDNHVTMREGLGPLAWEQVTAWPGEGEVRFVGRNRLSTFEGVYRFDPAPGGSRVALDVRVDLAPGLRWSEFAARPVVEAILRLDLRGHVKDMRRDIPSA